MKLTVKGFAELTVTELYEILRLRVDAVSYTHLTLPTN